MDLKKLKKELEKVERPLIYFDDDPDGLCSFLMVYKFLQRGTGVLVKSAPHLDKSFAAASKNYQPDKIIVLDKAGIDQEFIDEVNTPIIWVDHHGPLERKGDVQYFNPRIKDPKSYVPTSLIIYNTLKNSLWLSAVGTIGDWADLPYLDELNKKYPKLVGKETEIENILFKTNLGKLVNIFSFILKGATHKVMQCVKILTRIEDPMEILEPKTAAGKYLKKHYHHFEKEFLELKNEAIKSYDKDDPILLFSYGSNKTSFTADIAKYLIHAHPEKIVIVARENDGRMKMSLRSRKKVINKILPESIEGLDGYGGGHELACGANVLKSDFDEFIKRFREKL